MKHNCLPINYYNIFSKIFFFYFYFRFPTVSLSPCLSVTPSLCLSVSLSLCLSVSLSLCLSVSLSLCLSVSKGIFLLLSDLLLCVRLRHPALPDRDPLPVHAEATLASGRQQDLARISQEQTESHQARSRHHRGFCSLLGPNSGKFVFH
jgi:hypothetical protein